MSAVLRAKLRVDEVLLVMNDKGAVEQERVKLRAVYGTENTENALWSKWTPSAEFQISINNPDAIGKLSRGHEYYVDFIPVV